MKLVTVLLGALAVLQLNSTPVLAEKKDLEDDVRAIKNSVRRMESVLEDIRDSLDGNLGHSNNKLEVKVDIGCISTLHEKYPYSPNKSIILKWIGSCKDSIEDNADCELSLTRPNSQCVDKATDIYPYTASESVLDEFATACRTNIYICK